MGWSEKRGRFWRARWTGPDGKTESMSGFLTKKDSDKYWRKQETAIDEGRYVDPRAGQITLTEWATLWYSGLDLEPSTMENIRYHLESFALVEFGDRAIAAVEPEEINAWEKGLVAAGYAPRTAKDVRATLSTCLGDAVPSRIPRNPAERGRTRGRKAARRIERKQQAVKAWVTPLEAFLTAERVATLTGRDADFVMVIALAYTGARWSEIVGLPPDCIRPGEGVWDLHWKLYELNGRFYRGWPKDGSARTIDVPPFLDALLGLHMEQGAAATCTCPADAEDPYCAGDKYVFLGPDGGHARRSDFSRRFFRPAADGRWPGQWGKSRRPPLPVLADVAAAWPGTPLVTAAPPGWGEVARALAEEMRAQGVDRVQDATGRALVHARRLREIEAAGPYEVSGYARRPERLPVGSRSRRAELVAYALAQGVPAAEAEELSREQLLDRFVRARRVDPGGAVVAWLPVMARLTPHGLRHSHETWMAEDRIADVLREERMGHVGEDDPGARRRMRDHYTRISEQMRGELVEALQRRWETSLADRVELERRWGMPGRSPVGLVNDLLEPYRAHAVAPITAGTRIRALQPVRQRRLAARAR